MIDAKVTGRLQDVQGAANVGVHVRVGRMIGDLEKEIPAVRESMLAALGKVVPSHLLDRRLFDFYSLSPRSGDVAGELDAAIGFQSNLHAASEDSLVVTR